MQVVLGSVRRLNTCALHWSSAARKGSARYPPSVAERARYADSVCMRPSSALRPRIKTTLSEPSCQTSPPVKCYGREGFGGGIGLENSASSIGTFCRTSLAPGKWKSPQVEPPSSETEPQRLQHSDSRRRRFALEQGQAQTEYSARTVPATQIVRRNKTSPAASLPECLRQRTFRGCQFFPDTRLEAQQTFA